MAKAKEQEFPTAELRDVLAWFRAAKVRGVVIGGIAVSLLGEPRDTEDVDLVVVIDDSTRVKLVELAEKFGVVGRVPDVLDFARDTRMLLMRHASTGTSIDISLGMLDFEQEMIDRAKTIQKNRLKIPVASPDFMIVLKILAQRPQDIADIANILNACDDINLSWIRQTVKDFSSELDRSDMVDDLERLLTRHAQKRKK